MFYQIKLSNVGDILEVSPMDEDIPRQEKHLFFEEESILNNVCSIYGYNIDYSNVYLYVKLKDKYYKTFLENAHGRVMISYY